VETPINILIVDDSAMMRSLIKRAVTLSGAAISTLHEAANGQEALAVLEQHPLDVVFTDINMPVMNGMELLQAMVGRGDRWAHIKRVIVSTDGSHARRDLVKDLRVETYVEKPFVPEVIRDVLQHVAEHAVCR
jgi:two-component system, chemotaxis family, chemotaxis protein CheY